MTRPKTTPQERDVRGFLSAIHTARVRTEANRLVTAMKAAERKEAKREELDQVLDLARGLLGEDPFRGLPERCETNRHGVCLLHASRTTCLVHALRRRRDALGDRQTRRGT